MANQNKRIDYTDLGFDWKLQRKGSFGEAPSEKLDDDISTELPTVRTGNIYQSPDKRLIIDYTTGEISINYGRKLISLGNIDGLGKWYGIRINDSLGNVIFSAQGKLQSAGVEDEAIVEDKLASDSVTTTKIANLAVSTAKIANLAVTSAKVNDLAADKITTGTLSATTEIKVGDNNIKLSGTDKQIIINDGTNDRVLIGYQEDGF